MRHRLKVRIGEAAGQGASDTPDNNDGAPSWHAVHFSSDSADWYTPDHIIQRVMEVLGDIDLDPCADPDRTIPAATHFTPEGDGLSRGWHGRVYMNPPYGKEIARWVTKL